MWPLVLPLLSQSLSPRFFKKSEGDIEIPSVRASVGPSLRYAISS